MVESSTFFRRVGEILPASAHLWMTQCVPFASGERSWTFFKAWWWSHQCRSSVSANPTNIFPLQLCRIKIGLLLQKICTCSLQFLTKQKLRCNVSWMNISHENKQLSTWSNICWINHLKRKHWRCFYIIYHLVFHHLQHIWNAPLNSIPGKRYSSHFCVISFSKK